MNSFTWAELLCGISCFSPTPFHTCRSIGHIIQTRRRERKRERERERERIRSAEWKMHVFLCNVLPSRSRHARLFQCLHLSRFLMLPPARLTTGRRRRIFLMKDSGLSLSLSFSVASAHFLSGKLEPAEPSRETQSRCASWVSHSYRKREREERKIVEAGRKLFWSTRHWEAETYGRMPRNRDVQRRCELRAESRNFPRGSRGRSRVSGDQTALFRCPLGRIVRHGRGIK